MPISQTAQSLAKALGDPAVEDLRSPAQQLLAERNRCSAADAAGAFGLVAAAASQLVSPRGVFGMMVCGAAIEGGIDPEPCVEAMSNWLERMAGPAAAFDRACAEAAGTKQEDHEQVESMRREIAARMPDAATAWMCLQEAFPPAIAILSVSPAARRHCQRLVATLEPMAHDNQGAHWITRILRVLDDEPYVAIEPSTGRGVAGRMSGISVNFQLNVLLMDVFPRGWMAPARVSRSAVEVARGLGPQETSESLTGCWNLYTAAALRRDRTLADPKQRGDHQAWIWNEGTPADIPVVHGHRIILLGPASYSRNWVSQRDFQRLKAELTVDRKFGKSDLSQWYERILGAAAQ